MTKGIEVRTYYLILGTNITNKLINDSKICLVWIRKSIILRILLTSN